MSKEKKHLVVNRYIEPRDRVNLFYSTSTRIIPLSSAQVDMVYVMQISREFVSLLGRRPTGGPSIRHGLYNADIQGICFPARKASSRWAFN